MSAIIRFVVLVGIGVAVGYWGGTHAPLLAQYYAKAIALVPPGYLPAILKPAETKSPMTAPGDHMGAAAPATKAGEIPDRAAPRPGDDPKMASHAGSSRTATAPAAPADTDAPKRVRFYRNPMGLPDVSPVPKKDSMGMDYIPVYAGDEEEGSTIKVSPAKLQRTNVRSEPVAMRSFATPVRAPGTIQIDERRQSVISLRFEGWIEKVANVTTGAVVRKGQPLMRVYGPDLSAAAAQYVSILGSTAPSADALVKGARHRLENLGVPDSIIAQITHTRQAPRGVTWPAPQDGIVVQRNVTDGMRAMPGDPLFRVADISVVWVLADVSEQDLPTVAVGDIAKVTPRGRAGRPISGRIEIIYPSINKETRTARVRIELPNRDGLLLPDMYADVEIESGSRKAVLAVPDSAVIDSGERQVVIIDKGKGSLEPRPVKTGHRGEGYVEIRSGLAAGDKVVIAANFLIDAESNLKAALQGLAPTGDGK